MGAVRRWPRRTDFHRGVRRYPPAREISHPARADSDQPDACTLRPSKLEGRPGCGAQYDSELRWEYDSEYDSELRMRLGVQLGAQVGVGPDQGRSRRRAGGGASRGAGTP